jgi:hypothetical protein
MFLHAKKMFLQGESVYTEVQVVDDIPKSHVVLPLATAREADLVNRRHLQQAARKEQTLTLFTYCQSDTASCCV